MKNTILWSALFTLIGTQVHADQMQPSPATPSATMNAPATPASPVPTSTIQPALPEAAPAPVGPVINCEYKISAQEQKIDQSLVLTWSENAVTQAFSFNPAMLDEQLQKLQPCFTEQGWTGFNAALKKSGNIEAIKSQKLVVSTKMEGVAVVTEAKDNEWQIRLPIQVTYQNDKENVAQLLSVELVVGRKITGEFGITQMIATPRGTVTVQEPAPNAAVKDFNAPAAPAPAAETPTPVAQPPIGKPQ